MNSLYPTVFEKGIKREGRIFVGILCLSFIIAIGQSVKFSSSLWVIAQFGFIDWQEHISSMLSSLVIWAIVTGVMFAGQAWIAATTHELKKILTGSALFFVVGFVSTYSLVGILTIILYVIYCF